jgi:hypothetical protein
VLDVVQKPSGLGGEGDPQVGISGLGTMCDRYGLRDEAGTSMHLRMEGRREG